MMKKLVSKLIEKVADKLSEPKASETQDYYSTEFDGYIFYPDKPIGSQFVKDWSKFWIAKRKVKLNNSEGFWN